MRVAVSNSGPLIHLTLAGLLDFIFELFDLILIPPRVYDEIIVKGKEENHSDAYILERAINNKKIKVEAVKKSNETITSSKLHEAEIESIILSLQSSVETILLDDEEARIFARKLGIRVSGTLGILIKLFRRGFFGLDEALQYLKKINEVMYLSSDVYCYVENIIKESTKSD
jgi:predicted nucleic acid-binding protein